jgi:hypothetical protein
LLDAGRVGLRLLRDRRLLPPDPRPAPVGGDDDTAGHLGVGAGAAQGQPLHHPLIGRETIPYESDAFAGQDGIQKLSGSVG